MGEMYSVLQIYLGVGCSGLFPATCDVPGHLYCYRPLWRKKARETYSKMILQHRVHIRVMSVKIFTFCRSLNSSHTYTFHWHLLYVHGPKQNAQRFSWLVSKFRDFSKAHYIEVKNWKLAQIQWADEQWYHRQGSVTLIISNLPTSPPSNMSILRSISMILFGLLVIADKCMYL